ncbi:polyketide cyclase/dehydrase/lipid transport protein [Panacagrimonas perspica]|uniref:Polyketide cyclase/dehydrase/lipid transport protein n=1 Tax=Panacagrimonas perspica TaxID=381431 RepID=A0A4S3JZE8_9GAMM|nr:SRPBCC family protein [Panacagrimonas perspica]TDU32860.1 polyketide cyclase/dehydrase/lipid transport protein [Panacagrimonas perspica]THD00970.1 polyketide cyclase [Panacagrimonas perspica]
MLKIILVVIVVAIAGVLAYAATRPDTFRVERSISIKAPPEKIFPLIDDLQAWTTWSPYEKKDPAMQRTFGSITQGRGATYAWNGNKEVGQGSMEITESTASSRVAMNLNFIAPFEAHNQVEFTLIPAGDSTTVTWALFGPSPFISKLMGLVFDMDKMVGTDFEAGLASLKGIAES